MGEEDAGESATTAETTTTQAPAPEPAVDDLPDAVIARGELNCGVKETLPGFGHKDSDGAFTGFDVDLCRRWRPPHWEMRTRSSTRHYAPLAR